jgi:hypothetical protein
MDCNTKKKLKNLLIKFIINSMHLCCYAVVLVEAYPTGHHRADVEEDSGALVWGAWAAALRRAVAGRRPRRHAS